MHYIDYIKLKFERIDYEDSVVTNQTGYKPFILQRKINDRLKVYASSEELEKPILRIGKDDSQVVRIPLMDKAVFKLFEDDTTKTTF
jgi:hypothetical protein